MSGMSQGLLANSCCLQQKTLQPARNIFSKVFGVAVNIHQRSAGSLPAENTTLLEPLSLVPYCQFSLPLVKGIIYAAKVHPTVNLKRKDPCWQVTSLHSFKLFNKLCNFRNCWWGKTKFSIFNICITKVLISFIIIISDFNEEKIPSSPEKTASVNHSCLNVLKYHQGIQKNSTLLSSCYIIYCVSFGLRRAKKLKSIHLNAKEVGR